MRKWKHALLALAMGVLVLLSFLPVDAKASEGADGSDMISRYDFDEIDSMLEEIFPREQLGFKETLMGILSGDLDFSLQLLGELAADQLGYAFQSSRSNLIHMLLIALLAAVFSNFSKVFQSRQISDISFYGL